jgi:hypothetical protein
MNDMGWERVRVNLAELHNLLDQVDVHLANMSGRHMVSCRCGKRYQLGVDGTVHGCDACEGITRNPVDGTIIKEDPIDLEGKYNELGIWITNKPKAERSQR